MFLHCRLLAWAREQGVERRRLLQLSKREYKERRNTTARFYA